MNHIQQYIDYITEVNRIVQGLSNRSGQPADHVNKIWRDTEKEVVLKHKFGVTDNYRQIGDIVKSKLGVKPSPEEVAAADKAKARKEARAQARSE